MKLVINSRSGMPRLRETLESLGHEILEDTWDLSRLVNAGVDGVFVEFSTIFNRKLRFVELAWGLQKAGIPVVTWNVDSPWHMNRSQLKINLLLSSGLLSGYATHSLQNTSWIRKCRVFYLPNAAWVEGYNLGKYSLEQLLQKQDYRYDVSFLGNLNDRDYPEHRRRVEFLRKLEGFLKEQQLRTLFIDSQELSVEQQVDIIQESRINLSCMAAADAKGEPSWGLTERCYGVPACGAFLLMEHRDHIKDDFDLSSEIASYTDLQDCKTKILHYMEHDEERRQIMANAHHRVMGQHTYHDRAKVLVQEFEVLASKTCRPALVRKQA
jgi:spore maturation protein CgeB